MDDWADEKAREVWNDIHFNGHPEDDIAQALRDAKAEERGRHQDALQAALEAMATWCAVHAPDECTEENVTAAKSRIMEGGTLWYIATVTDKIDVAIRGEET